MTGGHLEVRYAVFGTMEMPCKLGETGTLDSLYHVLYVT